MSPTASIPDATAPIAITQGDSAGIGPEIIAKAFAGSAQHLQGCFVVGELQTLRRATALVADVCGGDYIQARSAVAPDLPAARSRLASRDRGRRRRVLRQLHETTCMPERLLPDGPTGEGEWQKKS